MANTNESERKTKPLKIRLTREHYAKLEALAAREGTTMGGWVAMALDAERKPAMDRRDVRMTLAANRRTAAGVR
jgi:predicted DNA-binding protein